MRPAVRGQKTENTRRRAAAESDIVYNKPKQSGLTLTELVVTVAVVAILLGVAVPAARRLMDSLQGGAGTHALISAALNNARAIAVREQKYAGIWFHRTQDKTYMILMVHDYEGTTYANGFRAVQGRQSIALPDGMLAASINNSQRFPVVFNSAGRLVIRPVRYNGLLPFAPMEGNYDSGLPDEFGGDVDSINQLRIWDKNESENIKTLMISPYTGELVGG